MYVHRGIFFSGVYEFLSECIFCLKIFLSESGAGGLPIILATEEAEIRRMVLQSQPGQIVLKTLAQKNLSRKRTGGVAQGVGPEFKPQNCKKKQKKISPSPYGFVLNWLMIIW
jgi:hypothetical protein